MAWKKRTSKYTGVRLTGLFRSRKKRNLFVGSADGDKIEQLIAIIKKARKQEAELAVFLWRNPDAEEGKPMFSLVIDVSNSDERPRRKARHIEPDDEDEDDDEEDKPAKKDSEDDDDDQEDEAEDDPFE